MSPILGVVASSITGNIGDYDWISSYVVPNTTTTSFSITDIPSTYKHLQLRGNVRVTRAGQFGGELYVGLNNDTTNSNYYNHETAAYPPADTTVGASWQSSGYPGFYAIRVTGSSAQTGNYAPFVLDIADYTNTNKKKNIRMLTGWDVNNTSNGLASLFGGLWQGTAAINRLDFGLAYGDFISQGSVFNLYGIKG
jgi:hypothetical protein